MLGAQGDFDSKASGTIGKKLKNAADELSARLGHTSPMKEQTPEVEAMVTA